MSQTPNPPLRPDQHFNNLRRWLEMEGDAERERLEQRRHVQSSAQAERGGETLLDMVVRTHTTGLGGRYLITLQKRRSTERLPWHRFKAGSPVILSPDGDGQGESRPGVVSARRPDSLEIAIDDWPEGDRFRLDLSPDEVTRKRQLAAMKTAEKATSRPGQLRDLMLYDRPPTFRTNVDAARAECLNESQQQAVEFAMSANDLAIIHGPPGTGKTTTVVELIRQAVANGERVLACAPSNTAVDNLLERLIAAGENAVRLGHPARVLEVVRSHTLDALVEQHDAHHVIHEMLREADQLERKASRFTRARPASGQKYQQRQEARELRRHARMLERQAIGEVIAGARVICATVSFDFSILDDHPFDLLVIDEACQSVEPGCWVPMKYADRIVLAGDHCQLPPTILSSAAAKEGYAVSLMQRLVEHYGDAVTRQLTVQYRMHEQIMDFSSRHFYDGRLTADDSVRQHLLTDLPSIDDTTVDASPVVFIDTAGAGWEEEQEPEGLSRLNPQEGRLVLQQVNALCEAGLNPSDIAVIAPYAAQVRWLRQHTEYDHLEVDTVDGFQGREKEAVVMCTVRSNGKGEVGFLSDARRMNVALTRARRKLVVIGDSATLAADDFFTKLLSWFEQSGAYRSVWEVTSAE
ncbi:MAG: AAA family ATPase [Fuerstiella sp.]|nr:AAA family ATPase [Fuerstiella sp.]MCP4511471.1 AAA family ATPase [Fuerstiella sp.]